MGLKSWLFGDFIEEIEWRDNNKERLFFKLNLQDKEISYNAKLKVNEGEIAVVALDNQTYDIFTFGEYLLNIETLPSIATALNWSETSDEPFRANIYFLNKESFVFDWSNKDAILLHDRGNSIAKLEANITYKIHIYDLNAFLEYLLNYSNTKESIGTSIIDRNIVDVLTNRNSSIYTLGSSKDEFSHFLYVNFRPIFSRVGLILDDITTNYLIVEEELPSYTGLYKEEKEINEDEEEIYYILKNSRPDGPYSKKDILAFLDEGKLIAASYIWREGLDKWVKIKEIFNLEEF